MLQHIAPESTLPRRVVVIGAAGFIGGASLARLNRAGIETLGLGRADIDLMAPDAADRLTALLREGDAVFCASAQAPCKTSAMLRDNMTMAAGLVTALARVPVSHVINLSSDAVYADLSDPLTEESWAAPNSLHGAMHLAREQMFKADIPAPLAILRPTLVYGAGDPHNGYGPNQFRRKANRGEGIVLFGEGEERRDHVCIDDVAELVTRIVLRRSSGILNVASGSVISFREVAELAVRLSGRAVTVSGSPRKGAMPHNGYRPFNPAATLAAFPDFRYTILADGMQAAQGQEFP